MFGEIGGLPVHALVVHAAVVAAPVAALLGLAFLVPKWRAFLRWPLLVVSAIALVTIFVARESGQALRVALGDQLSGNITGRLVARHAHLANELTVALLVMFLLAVGTVALLRFTTSNWLRTGSASIVAIVAIAVLVLTYQTGEAGAKARWNPDGSFDYSAK